MYVRATQENFVSVCQHLITVAYQFHQLFFFYIQMRHNDTVDCWCKYFVFLLWRITFLGIWELNGPTMTCYQNIRNVL